VQIEPDDPAVAPTVEDEPGPNGVAGEETGEARSVDYRAIASLVGVGIVNLM
jgi:hypothetical protein